MTDDLRVALVVPNGGIKESPDNYNGQELERQCHAGKIDLVVFGECFFDDVPMDRVVDQVADKAQALRTAVLGGMCTTEQYIAAGFANPNPREGDTERHFYLKHSSAPKLPYKLPQYRGAKDPMFEPIRFRGRTFGVNICHDMFFGLLSHRFRLGGATALIDLTGDNVQPTKWRCIGQGRSVELGGAFFCTMAFNPGGNKGKGIAFGYYDGVELKPVESFARSDGTGGFHVFHWPASRPAGPVLIDQSFSSKRYPDITLGLGGEAPGDIHAKVVGAGLVLSGLRSSVESNGWLGFEVRGQAVGVLGVPLAGLWDPALLYRQMPGKGAFQHHVVVYYAAETAAEPEKCVALARLRAVEHRIAVVVLAGDVREVLKTNNYKIQRFREDAGVFGLNKANLGGTWTTWHNAIYEDDFPHYLALVDDG